MMRIEPTGVVMTGICQVRTPECVARTSAPITAVWSLPARTQIDVCRACLEEMVRLGEWEIPGARIRQRADIAVYAPDGDLALVVEVKSNPPSDPAAAVAWAERIHRNLLVHAAVPGAPRFLLAGYPGALFYWHAPVQSNPFSEPDGVYFDASLFGRRRANGTPPPSAAEQERAVSAWVEASIRQPGTLTADRRPEWLVELFRELRGGTVMRQTPVFA